VNVYSNRERGITDRESRKRALRYVAASWNAADMTGTEAGGDCSSEVSYGEHHLVARQQRQGLRPSSRAMTHGSAASDASDCRQPVS
jgi:hypothetical protein